MHVLAPTLELANGGCERVVRIPCDDGSLLHAVLTEPAPELRVVDAPDVVILSTGSNPASGPGRLHTTLARAWATTGCRVLRVDRRGVGSTALLAADGAPARLLAEAESQYEVYDEQQAHDVLAIEQYLRTQLGTRSYVLVGTCSGAFAAFNGPRFGARPAAIVCLNQVVFDNLNLRLDAESPAFAIKARYELVNVLRDPRRWPAILCGDVPVRPALRRLMQYVRLRFSNTRKPEGLDTHLRDLARWGIAQVYLFDDAETGLGYLRFQASTAVNDLQHRDRLVLRTVTGAGHTFGFAWSREWVRDAIEKGLADVGVVRPASTRKSRAEPALTAS